MSPKENQTSPANLEHQAVKLELPADLLTQLEQVKSQADALSGGNPNWLDEQMGVFEVVFPGNWEIDEGLILRANLLKSVIRKNPEWWKKWGNEFHITTDGFKFSQGDIIFDIEDSFDILDTRGFPTLKDFEYIWSFIESSGYKNEIIEFLGFTQTIPYFIQSPNSGDNFFKYGFSFKTGQTEAIDDFVTTIGKKRFLVDLIPF